MEIHDSSHKLLTNFSNAIYSLSAITNLKPESRKTSEQKPEVYPVVALLQGEQLKAIFFSALLQIKIEFLRNKSQIYKL